MKKLGKKELEIVVGEVSKEICKVKKEKLIEKYRKPWIKREHPINDMFHKISTKIIEICKKAKMLLRRKN